MELTKQKLMELKEESGKRLISSLKGEDMKISLKAFNIIVYLLFIIVQIGLTIAMVYLVVDYYVWGIALLASELMKFDVLIASLDVNNKEVD